MTEKQRRRLEKLQDQWSDAQLLWEFYGLKPDEAWIGRWRAWARQRPVEQTSSGERMFHRYRLETFFQQAQLLPMKWAAARLGMEQRSLQELLDGLGDQWPRPPFVGDQLVDEVLIRDFSRLFKEDFEFTVFGNHDDFCQQMHAAIQRRFPEVEITPLHCATAALLGEEDYAYEFDAITLEPLGLRYQVWLDLAKPMNLRPDACGLAFYAQNRDALRELVFGDDEPVIPPSLLASATP